MRNYHELASPLMCRISLYPDNQPKKYRLSPQLQRVLGTSIQEESRTKIIGALWQYIKSNRLQESDETKYGLASNGQSNPQNLNANLQQSSVAQSSISAHNPSSTSSRQFINANTQDLLAIFGGQEKIQFHQIMDKLADHLFEVAPITLEFEIGLQNPQSDGGRIQRKQF